MEQVVTLEELKYDSCLISQRLSIGGSVVTMSYYMVIILAEDKFMMKYI